MTRLLVAKASNSESVKNHAQSPTAEEMEVESTNLHRKFVVTLLQKKTKVIWLSKDANDKLVDNDLAQNSPSPSVQPRKKGKKRIYLVSSEDSDDDDVPSSIQPQKRARVSSEDTRQKRKKKKPTTGQSKKSSNSRKKGASDDSEIEVVEISQKTPEKDLGMSFQ